MKRYKVTKQHMGLVEVRDYVAEQCVRDHLNIEIVLDGERMILKPEEIITKRVSISGNVFPSKIAGAKDYRLWSYKWNPNP